MGSSHLACVGMQTSLFEHFDNQQSDELDRDLNVLTLFEDLDTGKRAKQIYDYLAEHLGSDFRLNHQVWNLNVLASPILRELAAKDASESDILIISLHGQRELSPEAKSWLELWIGQRSAPIGLVALFDPDRRNSRTALDTRRYLESIAQTGRMDFFSEPKETENGLEEPEGTQRFNFHSGFSGQFGANDIHGESIPRWGIND
jgi:hypothetical protein